MIPGKSLWIRGIQLYPSFCGDFMLTYGEYFSPSVVRLDSPQLYMKELILLASQKGVTSLKQLETGDVDDSMASAHKALGDAYKVSKLAIAILLSLAGHTIVAVLFLFLITVMNFVICLNWPQLAIGRIRGI